MSQIHRHFITRVAVLVFLMGCFAAATDYDGAPTLGPAQGWLIIHGGGQIINETIERFVALAGGPNANFVVIPTAMRDEQIDAGRVRQAFVSTFRVRNVTVLHTRDRARADSDWIIGPLKSASGVWILGGRQWRLADAYLGTAVEREIKALLARGGVVGGGSAGATIQGSFLVRGAPGDRRNPDGDNRIMESRGHETGFGLIASSAIDQHINTRGREHDLDSVISHHPELLGIGIDESAAIIVHGDSFFVVGGQVAMHDGKKHDEGNYYFLSPGQQFNLRTRSVDAANTEQNYPLDLIAKTARRQQNPFGAVTVGQGILESNGASRQQKPINFECNVSMYSIGGNVYPARIDGVNLKIAAREVNSSDLKEYDCKYQ